MSPKLENGQRRRHSMSVTKTTIDKTDDHTAIIMYYNLLGKYSVY